MYIDIGNRREVLWDDYLVDTEGTTAALTMHKPVKKEIAYVFDKPWETKIFSYPHYIEWQGECLMYYIAGVPCEQPLRLSKDFNKEVSALKCVCLMKGPDPFHLERPNLGLYEVNGSKDNNVLLQQRCTGEFEEEFDNFFVFVDENPDCPADEKIKALAQQINHEKGFPGFRELWCYTSGDGINFKLGWKLSGADEPFAGLFDSLNTAHYDKEAGVYRMYVRGLHLGYGVSAKANETGLVTAEMEKDLAAYGIRDIRYMESKDFKTWTVPRLIEYNDEHDFPLYTNMIQRYNRAPHMYIGMPARYVERKAWTPNFDQLGGPENVAWRKERMVGSPRHGLAVTDAIFMSSRDGFTWNRFAEAFVGAEPEHASNWVYGDAYFLHNVMETPCEAPDVGTEITLLSKELTRDGRFLRRYTLRGWLRRTKSSGRPKPF